VKHSCIFLLLLSLTLICIPIVPAADFTIESITFEVTDTPEPAETVHIQMNSLHHPVIFGIVNDNPRVVCDFNEAEPSKAIERTIETNARYIKRIRTGFHSTPKIMTRIVLDLTPNRDYTIQQIPSPTDNRFSIVVKVAEKSSASAAENQSPIN
jgi:hypothetical protein